MQKSLSLATWFLAAAGMIIAAQASAHARLRGSVPAADAQLSTAPTTLTLTFNEPVQLAVLTVSAGGRAVPVSVDHNAPAAARVTVPLPALGVGKYQVQWSALSADDGHVTKGTLSFEVLTPAAAPAVPAATPH